MLADKNSGSLARVLSRVVPMAVEQGQRAVYSDRLVTRKSVT